MKIKFKLSIMVIVLMTVVVVGISYMLLTQASVISRQLSLRGKYYLADHKAEFWKGHQDGHLRALHTLANVMANYEYLEQVRRRDIYDQMLESTLKAERNMAAVFTVWKPGAIDGMDNVFTDRPGSTITGQYAMLFTRESGRIEGSTVAGSEITNAMAHINGPNARRDMVEDPFPWRVGTHDTYAFIMRVPIMNPYTGETVGIVGCLLFIDAIQPIVEETINNYSEIAAMTIFAGNGMILGHLVPSRVGSMLIDVETIFGGQIHEANSAVREGKPFEQRTYSPVLESMVEIVIKPFSIGDSGTSWSVMLVSMETYIMSDVQRMTMFTVFVAAAALILSVVIVFLILQYMTTPLVEVTETLKDIAQGEGDLTHVIPEKGRDEISQMAVFFNMTIGKIRAMVKNIGIEANALSGTGIDLSNNMTETAAAMNEITANIQSIRQRMINQSASVTETNAVMEQITININKLYGHVEKQISSVSQSSSAIEQMLANIHSVTRTLIKNGENVDELTAASEVGRNGLQDVAADIQEIARESEGLLEINAVMENIASQTNLLSMNAAIEAAHAGESGRGFAVVADEIRKLAESSSVQSKTISMVLKKMKNSIDKITISTDSVLARFEAIDSSIKTVARQEGYIRNAMEEQGQGSKQILEAIALVNETTQMVKNVSQEMLEGAREVIHEADNLEKATQEITSGVNEMATGADQVNTAVNHVNELSGRNRELIGLLSKEVSRFKVK